MPQRRITELERLQAKIIIDEHANKAARWAARWNALPLIGGRIGQQIRESIWQDMAMKLGKLFDLESKEIAALRVLPVSHWVGTKYMWGRELVYMLASFVPDFGVLTRSAVEDLARSMTKTMGWIFYLVIEDDRLD